MRASITREPFGQTVDGGPVERYILDAGGIRAAVITYGAALQMLETPGADGSSADIAPGFDNIGAYERHKARFGAVIGRTAGRINGGLAPISGQTHQLSLSGGKHHLHGGFRGYDKRVWQARAKGGVLELWLTDNASEGYPGNIAVTVRYRTEPNALIIEWEASADADTLCNMTTHAYWNLSGHASGSALCQYMQINATQMVELDEQALPTGRVLETEGSAYDFLRWRRLHDSENRTGPQPVSGCYLLRESGGNPAAQMWEPVSGRWMRLYTDQPALHYYSGYLVKKLPPGKQSACYEPCCGICLEPQAVSDGIHHPQLPSPLLAKGEVYRRFVKYEFLCSKLPPMGITSFMENRGETMRAAKLIKPNVVEVLDVPFMPNPGEGEVVVQVKAVGICGTDLHIFQGHRADVELPRVMGHELSGVVSCVGAGVTALAPADEVVLDPVFACGQCPACENGHPNVCANVACFGVQMDGGFQDYITVPAHRLHKFPKGITMEQAALAEPYSIAANITSRTGVQAGERAVIIGAGTIGLVLVQAISAAGASVLVSDVVDSKLETAKAFGAVCTVNSKNEDLAAAVMAFAPGGAEIVIDAVGITHLTQQSLEFAAPAARVGIIGFDNNPLSIPAITVTKKELTLVGSRMNNGQFPKVMEWLAQGKVNPQPMITGVYPLERIQEAFDYTLANPDKSIKTIIDFNSKPNYCSTD